MAKLKEYPIFLEHDQKTQIGVVQLSEDFLKKMPKIGFVISPAFEVNNKKPRKILHFGLILASSIEKRINRLLKKAKHYIS